MDPTTMSLCGKRIVDNLRSETELAYDHCANNAMLVISTLMDIMEERSVLSLDLLTLKKLQQEIIVSQDNLSAEEVRGSRDYKQAVLLMHELESYRKGSDNREMMWQGGNWNRNNDKWNSPVNIISSMQDIFEKANPLILREVVEYPGNGSVTEFQLVDLLADELQWVLQSLEPASLSSASQCSNEVCSLLLASARMQPKAVDIISSSPTLRSTIFRLMMRLATLEPTPTPVRYSHSPHPGGCVHNNLLLLKLATLMLSAAFREPSSLDDMIDEESAEAAFPQLKECVDMLLFQSFDSYDDTVVIIQQQLVAFWISLSSFLPLPLVEQKSHPFSLPSLLNKTVEHRMAAGNNDVLRQLETVVETAVDWWNHELQGSVLDRNDPEKDFGLVEPVSLTAKFLAELVVCTYDYGSNGRDDTIKFSTANKATEDRGTFLVSRSSCDVLRTICERIMIDHSPEDKIHTEAEKLLQIIARIRS